MNKNRMIYIALFALISLPLENVTASPINLIYNGSFEDRTGTYSGSSSFDDLYAINSNIPGWTVTQNSVGWVADTYWQASDGNMSIDLSGNPNAVNGTLVSDDFGTMVGSEYSLYFDMAGNPDGGPAIKTLEVFINGFSQIFSFDTTGTTRTSMGWTTFDWNFYATSLFTDITFRDISTDTTAFGPAIDNVRVYKASSVPEPGTLVLLIGGLFAMVAGERKIKSGCVKIKYT